MSPRHSITVTPGPSGLRAVCTCGWGSVPRYTADRAHQDASTHEVNARCTAFSEALRAEVSSLTERTPT